MPSTPPTARPLSADPSGARARVIAPPTLVWLLLGLVLASTIVSALLLWRLHTTGALTFVFLGWNLFLAWLPLVVALMMVGAHHGGLGGGWLLTLGLPWLLLLPNAPYIITDLIHLRPRHDSPLWFDAVLIIGFAVVGLMLGLVSLLLVHRITTAHVGRAGGWLLVVLVLAVSASWASNSGGCTGSTVGTCSPTRNPCWTWSGTGCATRWVIWNCCNCAPWRPQV